MTRTALIIGITGNIGRAAAEAFIAHGWRIRALHRNPPTAESAVGAGIDWHQGDALNRADTMRAAADTDVIVHAANPPGYKNWRTLALPMLENTIAAASAFGARILLPGNVYNYGPDAGVLVAEDSPQNPLTRKGRIRVQMEAALQAAADRGVRSIIVRAGDFFGPGVRNAWFDQLVKPGRPVKSITYPGDPEAGHAWAHLPDLAETLALIAEREQHLPASDRFHFGGHYMAPGIEMVHAIRRVAAAPDAPVRKLPWFALYAAAPFHTLSRELLEMRYLWRISLQLDNRKLVDLLGEEPHTALDEAVHRSLQGLDCMPPVLVSLG